MHSIQIKPTHFIPEGKPAPPRPRRPEALISEIIYIQLSTTALPMPISMPQHTQSWPLRIISFVLCQSPYFLALARSAPWCPYRFWKIRSRSFNPPKWVLFGGGASWTVASPRLCCAGETEEGNREATHAVEGRTRVDREETTLGEGACRESIVKAAVLN
jgi:hypothetical protein